MNRTRTALLGTLLVLAGILGYDRYRRVIEEHDAAAARAAAEATLKALQKQYPQYPNQVELAAGPVKADLTMALLPKTFPRPASAWQAAEKTFYENLLSAGSFEILVVPFQVQELALDRSTRSLMTAELALAIGAARKKVPDPYLVARALGDGQRRFSADDVYRLAGKLHVAKVVWGYVGHRDNRMRITIQQQVLPDNPAKAGGELESRNFEGLPFSAEDPPIEVYRRLLPDLLKTVGIDAPIPAGADSPAVELDIPSSPLRLASEGADPAREAFAFQLLAALTPAGAERTRERFAEKSMLAVLALSPASADYPVLKARAFMQMGLRPAALKVLGTPTSDEGRHLLARLNGNLPDVQRYAPRVTPGIRALIAKIELNELASSYGARTQKESLDQARRLNLPGQSWSPLAARAFTDWDSWSQQENATLKPLLDRDFPIPAYTVEQIVRGGASLGDLSKIQLTLDLSVLEHIRKYTEAQANEWCCTPLAARFAGRDYLDLLEGIGNDNLVRRAHLIAWNQGLPQQALEFLARIDGGYRDQPELTLERARAELSLAREAQGTSKDGLQKSAYEHAFNAYYWEQGQTRNAATAWDVLLSMDRRDYGILSNIYSGDTPTRPFFSPDWGISPYAAIENSTDDFTPVTQLSWGFGESMNDWGRVEELLKSIEGRFAGNPALPLLLARISARNGDFASAERYYREGIKAQPRNWTAYLDLGRSPLERAEVAKAAQVLMSYPGFRKNSGENAVGLSNDAFSAASLFYWSGNFAIAMPLYRISAELRTGSNASLTSENRITMARGDYPGALIESLQRARRYNSEFGYRDYLGMLHAMGHSPEAWDAFNALVVQMEKPEIWETPLVGHRKAGASESEIAQWAGRDPVKKSGYAGMYLLRAGVTDRTPTQDLPASIVAVERPVWKLENAQGLVVRASTDGRVHQVLNSEGNPEATLPLGVFDSAKKVPVKSDLVYFAEAYRLMRSRDFPSAKNLLEEALALYDTRHPDLGYLLPYYAFAAARSGDAQSVAARLEKIEAPYQRFDYYLARAVVTGLAGRASESLQDLKLALYRRPFTRYRPVYTEYEFAEIAEWLYQATKNPKYRDAALSWAKSVQQFSPWFGWSYAMEATLTTNQSDRERAIAIAFYLDPKSERLGKIPRSQIDAASKALANRNPFLRKQRALDERGT
jgi:hypothetical protein